MPLKVLVVDDATFVRDLIKRTLRQMIADLELFEAPDGTRAMSLVKSKAPDLILSDWEMPQVSGDELLRWVREQDKSAQTPFIMITSRGDRDHVVAAAKAGVSDYLCKPFNQDELSRKIDKQLKRMGYQGRRRSASPPSGVAQASIDVLTGGQSPREDKAKTATTQGSAFKGKAYLRFSHTTCECRIQELNEQAICLEADRPDLVPAVFDQTSVDLVAENGGVMARINAYLHSVAATEPNPDCTKLRMIARFVDDDPGKKEVLQSLIQ